MDEKTAGFNETQLKRVGFAEAFTSELKTKMEHGVPIIQHNFKKDYEGDEVNAVLHLKKSSTSDLYFLNKFDVQLQKDGQLSSVKQTFYITASQKNKDEENGNQQKNKQETKYTLKEAYNLLSGRPVYKDLTSKEGQPYQAWVKLDFKEKLDSGNHKMKQYTSNYGYELENVMAKYAIKELISDQYKQSLVDSLHRGNLQKVTFVGEGGKEEKLLVSPNISFGSLNVYDLEKQRLTTEQLLEKKFIGSELATKLTEHIAKQKKPEQKEAIKEIKKPQQKQVEKAPVKKQRQRQKVN